MRSFARVVERRLPQVSRARALSTTSDDDGSKILKAKSFTNLKTTSPLVNADEPDCCVLHHTIEPKPAPTIDYSLYPVQMDTSMKALIKARPEPGLVHENVNIPAIGDTDVLVKVKKASICGTDLHIWNWDEWSQATVPTPLTIGHEFGGIVHAVGSKVRGIKVGERVTAEGHITCGYCRNCQAGRRHLCRNTLGVGVNRPGCFAEFVSIPATNIFKLPKAVPDDVASVMDPLGNAVHSALSFDLVGEDVLITGAGPIGMMCAAICKQVGARHVVVTDVNEYRLNLSRHCGADVTINVAEDGETKVRQAMGWLGMKEGFDIGLEMSGSPQAMQVMLSTINNGGRISMLGIPAKPFAVNWSHVIFKGLTIKGIYGREMFETWYKMSNLLTSGLTERIRPVLTHELPADDFKRGFEVCRSANSGKIVLDWS